MQPTSDAACPREMSGKTCAYTYGDTTSFNNACDNQPGIYCTWKKQENLFRCCALN
jgi:hypothetical protein